MFTFKKMVDGYEIYLDGHLVGQCLGDLEDARAFARQIAQEGNGA